MKLTFCPLVSDPFSGVASSMGALAVEDAGERNQTAAGSKTGPVPAGM